ncbi:hypothetical protein HAX54_048391 [Datura stramonium]|uniref:Uncharacterized protein n=1 Tax=Datura stramonium TaxID=4076 RepID=A0ABS8WN11_DATST|nr:hypothetical protein [Datura stramonium]
MENMLKMINSHHRTIDILSLLPLTIVPNSRTTTHSCRTSAASLLPSNDHLLRQASTTLSSSVHLFRRHPRTRKLTEQLEKSAAPSFHSSPSTIAMGELTPPVDIIISVQCMSSDIVLSRL